MTPPLSEALHTPEALAMARSALDEICFRWNEANRRQALDRKVKK